MLKTECEEHLAAVRKFADERGLRPELERWLKYLDEYAGRHRTRCRLMTDSAPHSFYFIMQRLAADGSTWHDWFSGGCVYYGRGDSGVGAPQFSVRLGDLEEGWSINT